MDIRFTYVLLKMHISDNYVQRFGTGCKSALEAEFLTPFFQWLEGNLQQSPAAAGSFAPASRTTFQLPSDCFRQMVI